MTETVSSPPYRVLARKYRPSDFAGLIGQEAMVRTLTNAIQSGRLAHAFVLTGVRGVGKTTTARIIARALNCIGPDGTGGPTIAPCGQCDNCRAIAEDRHVDVMEMDAASRTGVNDIRELIEGVRYRPTSARFKIYIIDEVHMLSTAAFNALLKTLEEPPEHVKFIFATTEIRKIPITVLSRCQRFDLRRVEIDTLSAHFAAIAEKESARVAPAALAMIARAADGSVRDGLSLLDQAIAHCGGDVTEEQVRDMLGLADRARVFDLLDAVMKGDIANALAQVADQYNAGADPVVILQDMLELTHWLTRLKVAPDQADGAAVGETERVRGREMAQGLSMATLTRAWQMLLKGLNEARSAPSPLQATEMALVRLAYAAELPSPAELIESLRGGQNQPQPPGGGGNPRATAPSGGDGGGYVHAVSQQGAPQGGPVHGPQAALRIVPPPEPAPPPPSGPRSFEEVYKLCDEKREALIATDLMANVHLVKFETGRIEIRLGPRAAQDLPNKLGRLLTEWTGMRWVVTVSSEPGEPTLMEQRLAAEQRRREDAANHPLVQAVLAAFPGASIEKVLDLETEEPAAALTDADVETGDEE
ncbi:DNA polymerase III subunit gamma/tau [Telmatospirillum sp. J64-1]|uniref:DNA polymerase III subunit gamma/tau n=1 Tax=Telmatospirillum sp. J64-1 TaxID=2502183 RepID=UPI00115E8A53|nr:DNA polymerase III subunit gamma/tau [Telmatospirillum sp. J64-1]